MFKYIKITIKETSKPIGSKKEYQLFNEFEHFVKDKKEAKEYLDEKYQKCKREKMYIDNKQGVSRQTGWIYGFKNKDVSHDTEWWWQRDWVSITKVEEKEIIIK